MDGPALDAYLERPLTPPAAAILAAIDAGPAEPADALALADIGRMLDPAPLAIETGWCRLDDGVCFVAVRTPLPGVTAAMVDWWFDWHPREAIRYRVWHPVAHFDNRLDPPAAPAAKPFWGATHHPVEDVGTGVAHARIEFLRPTELGLPSDGLDDAAVGTIVCGYAGDDRRRIRHSPMCHVFLDDGERGLVLRSHFWMGAALPRLLNRPAVRRRVLPDALPRGLAHHCAEEYANLGALLPELYARFAADG